MAANNLKLISDFYVAGINYKKSDAAIRGKFSVGHEQNIQLIERASAKGISEFFVLSTCNRTEIFGFAENEETLSQLLCSVTEGNYQNFKPISYAKQGMKAIEHLFNVAAGLDSQILGDYEITGQIKQAAKFSKLHGCLAVFMERLINEVLQASKKIRTDTTLSGGTVSVSFAAIQYIKQLYTNYTGKNILLIGTGKIGSNTCKNIVDYLPGNTITLLNRSQEKAKMLAEKFNLQFDEMENLQHCINKSDIIIVATNAEKPIILRRHISESHEKLLIDLSVPANIAHDVAHLKGIILVNVDELSRINDETLQKRKQEIPKALSIIADHVAAFEEWHSMRKNAPVLRELKSHLQKITVVENTETLFASATSTIATAHTIQKVINGLAVKMRSHNKPGCFYIEAINDFMNASVN